MWKKATLGLLAVGQLTCHQVILTAPPGSTLDLFANPEFIPANGGVSVVTALLIEPTGTPVADGTVVQFFTNMGRIPEQAKTNDGVARVNFVSDHRSGTARITATSGGGSAPAPSPSPTGTTDTGGGAAALSGPQAVLATDSIEIRIGSALPDHMIVTANPTRILVNDPRHSRIVANVLDDNGNPVFNVPVFFKVEQGETVPTTTTTTTTSTTSSTTFSGRRVRAKQLSTEFMRSAGSPIFTDTNGQAVDFLETTYPRDQPPKTVIVTVTTANEVEGEVEVTIN